MPLFTARTAALMAVAVVFLATGPGGRVASQSAGPALSPGPSSSGSSDCMTSLLNMSACLTYVQKGGQASKPDKGCCPALAGLVDSNPICLCQLLGKSDSFGVQIDLNRALKLPQVCKVQTPPVSLCSEIGVPVGAPTAGEDSMAPGGSSPASSRGTGGSAASSPESSAAAAPPGEKSGNGASSIARSSSAFLIIIISTVAMFF